MRRQHRPAGELRTMIDLLPLDTRRAMLEGVENGRILVDAYVNRRGGLCPMFAAHKENGLRSAVIRLSASWSPAWECHTYMRERPRTEKTFADAWDRYSRGRTGKGPRPATESELCTLKAMLEGSIDGSTGGAAELSRAIAEQMAAKARRALELHSDRAPTAGPEPEYLEPEYLEPERLEPEPVRSREPEPVEGWAWLRVCRSYDEYEGALRELGELDPADDPPTKPYDQENPPRNELFVPTRLWRSDPTDWRSDPAEPMRDLEPAGRR